MGCEARAFILHKPYVARGSRAVPRDLMKPDVRSLLVAGLLLASHCAEWVPANLTDTLGQERVLVHGGLGASSSTPTFVLSDPSPKTLRTLQRNGARFEVRRANVAGTIVLTTAVVLVIGLFVAAAYVGSRYSSFAFAL